jgi:hypothetical protein
MYQLLPHHLVKTLEASNKIVVLSGDITCPNSGLEETALATLRDSVSIFIHVASRRWNQTSSMVVGEAHFDLVWRGHWISCWQDVFHVEDI